MSDKPILFSAPMVRAILREIEQPGAGKKQTRRVLTTLSGFGPVSELGLSDTSGYDWHFRDKGMRWHDLRHAEMIASMPYQVGDRLYVREAHHRTNDSTDSHLVGYDFADGPVTRQDRHNIEGVGDIQFFRHSLGGWGGRTSRNYPAMHMSRWASRITLIVTEVRVQRVQEISQEDAIAEGIELYLQNRASGDYWRDYSDDSRAVIDPRASFRSLWDSLNAARGYGWEANPWVAAYTFRPILGNIDQIGGDA